MTREQRITFGTLTAVSILGAAAFATVVLTGEAYPHEAMPTAAMPLGWAYPVECCHKIDCGVIDAKYVQERPDGYHVNLPVGSHPMLRNKGYSGVVPYSAARNSPDSEYHICLGLDGYSRFCFFAGARGS